MSKKSKSKTPPSQSSRKREQNHQRIGHDVLNQVLRVGDLLDDVLDIKDSLYEILNVGHQSVLRQASVLCLPICLLTAWPKGQ